MPMTWEDFLNGVRAGTYDPGSSPKCPKPPHNSPEAMQAWEEGKEQHRQEALHKEDQFRADLYDVLGLGDGVKVPDAFRLRLYELANKMVGHIDPHKLLHADSERSVRQVLVAQMAKNIAYACEPLIEEIVGRK